MILYDKDTRFLGASADVLSALGYEDINVFRTYNNDVADLFVKRQGYVYKFDNFSWISYVLNGSLPNKNVVIKTRSGSEIEASISITELFLNDKNDKYYLVCLNNIHRLDVADNRDDIYDKQPIFKIENSDIDIQPLFGEQQSNVADSMSAVRFDENDKISFAFNEEVLKPIFPAADETKVQSPKSETVFEHAAANTPQTQAQSQNDAKSVEVKIDTQEVSDLLGITKEDIVKYLKEYADYLDENLILLRNFYQNGNISQARHILVNLIGIGSNLRSKELVQILQKLLSANNSINNTLILQELETVVFAFKQSVSKL
ncbi:MAG: hypothetical protein LBT96_03515 [Campylobacteraceae bacterium]|nr:hypothetical protein [Campylobacteraceae bacterium]